MMSRYAVRGLVTACAVAAVFVMVSTEVAGQATGTSGNGTRERYTAFAVDIGHPGQVSAGQVEIVIERWSPDAERDRLMQVLLEKGPVKLLEDLQKLPRKGYIRTPNTIGYDIHFARKRPGEDGGQVVTLMTDRYISFWEAANRPRTIDYPFTLIEMHIGRDGTGEGKMSIATKIAVDKKNNAIVLEDYKSQPVMLKQVKKEAA